jgi:hypothetical protein
MMMRRMMDRKNRRGINRGLHPTQPRRDTVYFGVHITFSFSILLKGYSPKQRHCTLFCAITARQKILKDLTLLPYL